MDIPFPYEGTISPLPGREGSLKIPDTIDSHREHKNCGLSQARRLPWRFTTEYVPSSTRIQFVTLDQNFEIEAIYVKIFHESCIREVPFREFIQNNFVKFKATMDYEGVPRECYSNKKAFRTIQYAVRLREHKLRTEAKLHSEAIHHEDSDHETPTWARNVLSRLQEIPSYDSDESTIENLEEREAELEELDEDYSEKTQLRPLDPDFLKLPDMRQYTEEDVPAFIMDAYEEIGSLHIITDRLNET